MLASEVGEVLVDVTEDRWRLVLRFENGHAYSLEPAVDCLRVARVTADKSEKRPPSPAAIALASMERDDTVHALDIWALGKNADEKTRFASWACFAGSSSSPCACELSWESMGTEIDGDEWTPHSKTFEGETMDEARAKTRVAIEAGWVET